MSQAAYYNGYDDGFIDGKRLGLALGGGSGAPSGPTPVVTPADALVPGALNVIKPTLLAIRNWSPIYLSEWIPDYETANIPSLKSSVDYVQGDPSYDEYLGYYVYSVNSTFFSQSYGFDDWENGPYMAGFGGMSSIDVTAHITALGNDPLDPSDTFIRPSGSFVSVPINGQETIDFEQLDGVSYDGPEGGLGFSSNMSFGRVENCQVLIDGIDLSKTEQDCPASIVFDLSYAFTVLSTTKRLSIPSIALGGAPGYHVVLVLPDGSSAAPAFAFTGATVTGTVPTAPGTYVLDLTKTSDGYDLSVANA